MGHQDGHQEGDMGRQDGHQEADMRSHSGQYGTTMEDERMPDGDNAPDPTVAQHREAAERERMRMQQEHHRHTHAASGDQVTSGCPDGSAGEAVTPTAGTTPTCTGDACHTHSLHFIGPPHTQLSHLAGCCVPSRCVLFLAKPFTHVDTRHSDCPGTTQTVLVAVIVGGGRSRTCCAMTHC